MERRELIWSIFLLGVVVAAFILPYTVLRDIARFGGAFAFWIVLTAVAIAGGIIYTWRWKR